MGYLLDVVAPVLEEVGYTLDSGELAFVMEEPVELLADQPNSYFYDYLAFPNPTFANFIISVDIEWDSDYGLAGCNIIFRAEDDIERGLQAIFETVRLSGYPGWDIVLVEFNQFQGFLTAKYQSSSAIELDPGAVNNYVLVVDGSSVTAYANGTRLGAGTMKAGHTEGQIAFAAWQNSGETTCNYTNAWVWELP